MNFLYHLAFAKLFSSKLSKKKASDETFLMLFVTIFNIRPHSRGNLLPLGNLAKSLR